MPNGLPSMRASAVTMPAPKARRQLQHRALVGQRVDHVAHVVDAQPVLGDRRGAARAGRRTPSSGSAPWKYERYCLATATASASSSTAMSIDAVGHLHARSGRFPRARTRRDRRLRSSPARPCRSRVPGGDDHVAAAEQRGVAGEAAARVRCRPAARRREAPRRAEGVVLRPATDCMSTSPGRPPPPSAKKHQRDALLARRSRTAGPSCGGCACPGCRPAPCSRRRHRPTQRAVSGPNSAPLTAADAGDHAVGGRVARSGRRSCGACAGRRWRGRRTR